MLRLEARKDSWGVYAEGLYLAIGDESRIRLGRFRIRGVEVDFDGVLAAVDFGGLYRIGNEREALDLMGGGRFTYLLNDASIGPIDADDSKSGLDPIIGARYRRFLGERWAVSLKGDIGGFGVNTDLVWGATVMLAYHLNQRATLGIGYRYYDFEQDEYNVQLYGPLIGMAFSF
jgi:hypothetical protein